ncbi:teneurin-3-like, partial [Clarias magur]
MEIMERLLSSQEAPPPPAPHHHKQHLSINTPLTNQKPEFQSASECVQLQENWVLGT